MTRELLQDLEKVLGQDQLYIEEPMKNHISFRVGGPAEVLVTPELSQLPEVLRLARKHEVDVTVIGNGSNLLVGDGGIRGLVIELSRRAAQVQVLSMEEQAETRAIEESSRLQAAELPGKLLQVEAGCMLSKAAKVAYDEGLGGMEFAAGIPGTMGGAVVMNAGAYGGEIKDILFSATVLTPEGDILELPAEALDLSYRHSIIPEKEYIVLSAKLMLFPKEQSQIKAEMDDYRDRRLDKQPLEYPSAGSTFKRPEGYFAGKLIQDAGLRGYRVGDAQVSEKHCGFVINRGEATAAEILQLISDVKQKVWDEFQVELEPEVKMLGDF